MSHFSMFVSTSATVKLANRNTVHSQGIGVILCQFTIFSIIYPVEPVYYFSCHTPNTISPGSIKFYVGLKNIGSEPLKHSDFVHPQGCYWRSRYHTQNNLDCLQIKIGIVITHRDKNICFQTVYALSKQNILYIIHNHFGHVSFTRLKWMSIKGLMKGLPTNLPDLK